MRHQSQRSYKPVLEHRGQRMLRELLGSEGLAMALVSVLSEGLTEFDGVPLYDGDRVVADPAPGKESDVNAR